MDFRNLSSRRSVRDGLEQADHCPYIYVGIYKNSYVIIGGMPCWLCDCNHFVLNKWSAFVAHSLGVFESSLSFPVENPCQFFPFSHGTSSICSYLPQNPFQIQVVSHSGLLETSCLLAHGRCKGMCHPYK